MQHNKLTILLFAGLSLGACNWVDSTGVQSGKSPGDSATGLQPRVVVLPENRSTTLTPSIDPVNAGSEWAWGQPTKSGALAECEAIDGFDSSIAAPDLAAACTQEDDCLIEFNFRRDDHDRVEFDVSLPRLKAPVGLSYTLNVSTDSGEEFAEQLTLCAIAINEAPQAKDDRFILRPDTTTRISANDPNNLLSNDADDVDVRNQTLQVLLEPARAPELAAEFELFADGGFLYRPQDSQAQSSRIVNDSFEYTVTDGLNPSTATVALLITDNRSNTPPNLAQLDDLVLTQGEEFFISIDADDDDDDPLQFGVSADTPDFVKIDPDSGALRGIAEAFGSHNITVVASDGLADTSSSFMMFVLAQGNNPPFADDIRNRRVSGSFSYNVSGFFGDRDDDTLFFSAVNLPQGLTISASGVISGAASAANRGRHIIRVFVDDGRGGVASDGFRLIIE